MKKYTLAQVLNTCLFGWVSLPSKCWAFKARSGRVYHTGYVVYPRVKFNDRGQLVPDIARLKLVVV
jgi:hypothetical protein